MHRGGHSRITDYSQFNTALPSEPCPSPTKGPQGLPKSLPLIRRPGIFVFFPQLLQIVLLFFIRILVRVLRSNCCNMHNVLNFLTVPPG